ncbi:TonB-dependent SusC/RagA subfamily outer membrane receptor [Dysgonomonas alginatilytica]|uniref:TonB-dependent SusC/RagA subfamily outer membrane receptor n=1 Tax=Dysgonomonas alginatilytica TaxID=1605892 RepID=A0A2V3PHG9_9BACT|nr:M56 family metallopeptidase [Dysgonomonas alginatilytica]PXV58411.1 TonB-dependent SusC/RagA subfamily outer membrane receptor [Dysgonomonas alginatilytica]
MKELITYIAQSGICIGIFFLIYRIFLRSTTFFRFNRAFLISGLIASFIIPSIRFSYDVVLPFSISANATEIASIQKAPKTLEIDIWLILSVIYLTGITIQLLRNLTSYRKLIKLIKSGETTKCDNYKLIDSVEIKSPFTVLNCIAINTKDLTETEKDLIIKHEITHISQKHWIDLLCSECALLLQWFNPLMWFYVSSQKENHEFLADKAVIDSGISPAVYQAALINQRFQGPVFSFSNSFNYPNQLNRLFMIKKVKTSPWRKAAILALIPSFGLFFWASATPRYTFKPVDQNPINQAEAPAQDSTIHVIGFGANNASEPLKVIGYAADNSSNTENTDPNKALFIIDGKESSSVEMGKLEPNEIASISVLKDKSSTEIYGDKGTNGVIIITTKGGALLATAMNNDVLTTSNQLAEENQSATAENSPAKDEAFEMTNIKADVPIFIVDGKEVSKEIIDTINPDRIESVNVWNKGNDETIALYGDRAKKGVVIVKLKK